MKAHIGLHMLRLFCHVYQTRSVSVAAERCAISQSAASYLLAQTREQTGDPLFVRNREGMVPTSYASVFYAKVKPALETLDLAMTNIGTFDPASSNRSVRIAMSDIGEMQFIPALLRNMHHEAPDIVIETHALKTDDLDDALRTNQIDFAIGYLPTLVDRIPNTHLFDEKYVCLYSPRNSYLTGGMSLDAYLKCPHIEVVSPTSYHNSGDRFISEQLPERKLGLRVAHYSSVPSAISRTNMIVTVPSRIARAFQATHDLVYADLPFETKLIEVRLFWSDVFVAEPGLAWMKQKITEAIRAV